jgi:hypothetical protein
MLTQGAAMQQDSIADHLLPPYGPGLFAMLAAGLLGITINTAILKAAPLLHIHPGAGGLLQLVLLYAHKFAPASLNALQHLGLSKPPSLAGYLWFHYASGLAAILFYFYVFDRYMPGPRWLRATAFASLFWLVNAGFVLPQLGQGFAGDRVVSLSGMLYFFVANWIFVAVSALSYRSPRRNVASGGA